MYLIYSILYLIALIFILPVEYFKKPNETKNRWFKERLGRFNLDIKDNSIWLHCVSVGEILSCINLIKKLKELYPLMEIIISTITDTGQKIAKEKIGDIAKVIYIPFDLPFTIKSAIKRLKPSLFIIIETELWPNLIKIMKTSNIPILLMNGRLSPKSFNNYKKIKIFIEGVLKNITYIYTQNEIYIERFKELGANKGKVKSIGNFKFDSAQSSLVQGWINILQSPLIVAGSTHHPEEELILNVYTRLKKDFPNINLVIAPRHPERFEEVEKIIISKKLKYLKRSEIKGLDNPDTKQQIIGTIFLLDVIGELFSIYSKCDIAIIGGSFIKHGGQNLLEPAFWGKVIVCGEYMENFPFVEEFYKNNAAIEVNKHTLFETLKELLSSKEKAISMGIKAKELYNKNSGATNKAIKIIKEFLKLQK